MFPSRKSKLVEMLTKMALNTFSVCVQVLREQEFNPNCLIRRSNPEDKGLIHGAEVAIWTNHRVMEWLRAVDLAEYAPNMRGSGKIKNHVAIRMEAFENQYFL